MLGACLSIAGDGPKLHIDFYQCCSYLVMKEA